MEGKLFSKIKLFSTLTFLNNAQSFDFDLDISTTYKSNCIT